MPQANLRPVIPLTTGCKRDVEKLLVEFKKAESLSFEAFSKCFREVDFVTIFMGRISCAELVEERIFGIYLTYSLYYVQPGDFVSSVRVTPEQAHDLAHFVQEILLPGGYHDAVLAYYRMVSYDTRSSRSTLKEKAYRTKAVNLRHRRHRASSEQCASVGTQEVNTSLNTLY
uniref:Histone acetyltransferase n=1 Tax=Syphacia muris TaxID=451379 RepID=A0A0N5ABJ0_9BILA